MTITRKEFLKTAGFSMLAVAGKTYLCAFSQETPVARASSNRRWAMTIDLVRCAQKEGCKLCIEACHKAHNVPKFSEREHSIEWIWKSPYEKAFPEEANQYRSETARNMPVPLFCNHCDNPPCVRVCPTKATWKRADGIVMMDWHRCIGCRYCMAACPYGSRSFNWTDPRAGLARENPDFPTRTKGVVEKCTFCEDRIAIGEPPACVQACPQEAMVFGNLDDPSSKIRQQLQSRFAICRKPELGTKPEIYYFV